MTDTTRARSKAGSASSSPVAPVAAGPRADTTRPRAGETGQRTGQARPLRADAQRNVERLIAVAREAFAAHGTDASLDDIARRAGVGSGTLYRHFPNREALAEAVYRDGVQRLCAAGERLLETESPGDALVDWLREFVVYVAQKRGLAGSLMATIDKSSPLFADTHAMIGSIGGALLDRARTAGAVRPDVELIDLMRLASAIAMAGETAPAGSSVSDRLLQLAVEGLRVPAGPGTRG